MSHPRPVPLPVSGSQTRGVERTFGRAMRDDREGIETVCKVGGEGKLKETEGARYMTLPPEWLSPCPVPPHRHCTRALGAPGTQSRHAGVVALCYTFPRNSRTERRREKLWEKRSRD